MSICKGCGEDISPFSTVCPLCGTPSDQAEKQKFHELKADSQLAGGYICKLCNNSFAVGDDVIRCEKCESYYHKTCFDSKGGCSQPVCKRLSVFAKPVESYTYQRIPGELGTHKDATYSLVFGILSLLCCAIIFGPLAILKANSAIRDIRCDNGYSGEGLALAGKILGIIGIGLWALILFYRYILLGLVYSFG